MRLMTLTTIEISLPGQMRFVTFLAGQKLAMLQMATFAIEKTVIVLADMTKQVA